MTSLQHFSGIGRKAVIAFIIISTFSLAAFAQRVEQQQGRSYGEPGFRGEPINLKVVNTDIRDILNYITEQYGVNFVIDKSVPQVAVTVNVNDVPWNIALDSIMRSQELGIQVNGPILRVADSKMLASEGEIFRAQQNNQLDSSPLFTEFIRLNYARASGTLAGAAGGAGQTSTGTSTGSSPTGGSSAGGGAGAGAGAGGGDQGILGIVRRRLSRRGAVEVDGRSNTLIVTDVRENIDAIRQLVTLLDQPEPQVEIEARIVVASRNFSRDVGVQIGALLVGTRGSGIGGSTLGGAPVDPRLTVPPSLPIGGINNNLGSQIANTAIGLTTGVFGTAQINLLITAGERKGQAKVIATPRVTTLNNRPAEIKSGTKIPITTIQPGGGGGQGGFAVATTEYVDVPLRLAITPQITDVGTVILKVVAENASTATIVSGAPPAINSQTVTTEVTVPDGGTTVVGGVLSDDEREGVERTPGISRIPIFGNLFKRKNVSRDTTELLFFITPRIYRPDHSGANTAGEDRPRTTTIVQPVPLGNPASNSEPPVTPNPMPVAPMPQASPTPRP
ncbi:MAG TPA: type IV pilus secretin PilQ [Pyrinomonadaceae bacterium]|nr:type IV pilus secretin PilQ [Pyrinomonadaceae bacterium]